MLKKLNIYSTGWYDMLLGEKIIVFDDHIYAHHKNFYSCQILNIFLKKAIASIYMLNICS